MMRKIFYFFFLVSVLITAQPKYYIFFKDKEISSTTGLSKTSQLYQNAAKELSTEAIERRIQVMGSEYITYEDLPIKENYIQQIEAQGIKIENKLHWFNAVTSYLNDEQVQELKLFPFIEKIERVRLGKKNSYSFIQTDPFAGNEDNQNSSYSIDYGASLTQLALSNVPIIHDMNINGANVYIGILDNGFNWKTNPALASQKVIREYDYIQKDNDVGNTHYHGTAVFSILGGYEPGKVVGPAYNAKFYLARTEADGSETKAEEDNYVAALQDMEKAGVQITSSSVGYSEFDDPETNYFYKDMNGKTTISAKAVNLAFQRGMFLVTAAGNEGDGKWRYIVTPADAFNVIAAGAVDKTNTVALFSSRGPTYDGRIKPEVCAMGVANFYALPNNSYGSGNGTSYATPLVSGIAGLLKSVYPHLTNSQMRKMFIESCDNSTAPNNSRGYGLLSATKVISYPALKKESTQFKICKIFINADGVNSSSVKINYKNGSGNFISSSMNYDGKLIYEFLLPTYSSGFVSEFYFTYTNNNGTAVREPATGYYNFSYGKLLIHHVTNVENYNELPTDFKLYQNFPNPFNPGTTIVYSIPNSTNVSLKVYDILGNEVASIVDEQQQPGIYYYSFSSSTASKSRGSILASGVYFYRLVTDEFTESKKMILLR